MRLHAGDKLGPYQIISPIGAGGMGEVYRARDVRLGREVAVKTIPGEIARDPRALERFALEARAASGLTHPHICTIHDIGGAEGIPFFVMELLEGEDLRGRLERGPIPYIEALRLAVQVLDALESAHSKGILHRDIKPANVFITSNGHAKVLDFGLAKPIQRAVGAGDQTLTCAAPDLTQAGAPVGTVAYMSPEQARGRDVDARSDLFSVGALLYEMLTGIAPFRRPTAAGTIEALFHEDPPQPNSRRPPLPPGLHSVLRKALEKDPGNRYQSAREFGADLQRILGGQGRSLAASASRWRIAAATVSVLLLIIAVAAWILVRQNRAPAIQTLAVLPLENLSGDAAEEYFADGMTDAITVSLGKIRALRVLSRQAVMPYKRTSRTPRQIARELGATAVLAGSVLRDAARVRVTAQLIEAGSERQIWSESYERNRTDVLGLQSSVARAIASEIGVALTSRERAQLARVERADSRAYDAYLRGRFLTLRRNPAENAEGIRMLEHAVQVDPLLAPAHAALAYAYVQQYTLFNPKDIREFEAKARLAADRAVSLDPDLAEAYVARGRLLWTPSNGYPHAEALAEFRRASDLNSNSDEAYRRMGAIYHHIGLPQEAERELRIAATLNPSEPWIAVQRGMCDLTQRKYEDAASIFATIPSSAVTPESSGFRAVALLLAGRPDQAQRIIAAALSADSSDRSGMLSAATALAGGIAGDAGQVEAAVRASRGKEAFEHFHHAAYYFACAYARLGKAEQATSWLEFAAANGMPCVPLFETDPNLDPLRTNPRFAASMQKLEKRWQALRSQVMAGSH